MFAFFFIEAKCVVLNLILENPINLENPLSPENTGRQFVKFIFNFRRCQRKTIIRCGLSGFSGSADKEFRGKYFLTSQQKYFHCLSYLPTYLSGEIRGLGGRLSLFFYFGISSAWKIRRFTLFFLICVAVPNCTFSFIFYIIFH